MSFLDYHDRDYLRNTNVMQPSGLITDVKSIADRVKETRTKLGWSQADLAKRVGVSQGTIGNIESGFRKQPRELLALARALDVDPNWLESGKGHEKSFGETSKGEPEQTTVDIDSTTSVSVQDGSDPMQSMPTLGATILHFAALLAAVTPLGRKSIAPLLASVVDDPESAISAAKMADAIATSQHIEMRDADMARLLSSGHSRPVETDAAPLGKK